MNQLRSINLDVVKRPKVLGAIGVVIALAIAFYFAWWSPEGHKLSTINATKQQQSSQIATLRSQLATVIAEGKYVQRYQTFLTFFSSEIPVQPEQGQLIAMLGHLANADHVTITTVAANTTAPATPTPGTTGPQFSTVPVSINATGAHANLVKFLSDLYTLPRLITIQSVNPSPGGGGGTVNVLARDSIHYSLTIGATAYFSGTAVTAP